MIIGSVFNNNAPLMMLYMVIIMAIAFIGVSPQFFKNSKRGLSFGFITTLSFMMAMFPIQSGDFIYTTRYLLAGQYDHFEEFYIWLYEQVRDIVIWRLVVFGGSTLLLYLIVKVLCVDNKFAAFIFVITQMFMFGALRNMFGLMMMFMGLSLLLYRVNSGRGRKISLLLCSIIALYLSTFLHRSMFMYVILALITIFIPNNKNLFKISILAFPLLWGALFTLLMILVSNINDPEIQKTAIYYADSERETTIMKTINEILKHGAYVYLLLVILRSTLFEKKIALPRVFFFMTKYAYILMYIGFLFYGQETGEWLYERFVWTGEISLMFAMMYFFYIYPRKRGVKLAFSILGYVIFYQILYICTHGSSVFTERFNTITL